MDKIILSVIIPVYNSEKYIKRCIESVVVNTDIRIECIVIDDGSTDNSLSISKDIEKINRKVRVFTKDNGGVSSARNLGLEKAKGKYIAFIDSDDYFHNGWDKIVFEDIFNENKSEFIIYSHSMLYNDGMIKDIGIGLDEKNLSNIKELDRLLFTTYVMNSCWAKIYVREILDKNNIRFDVNLKIGEDAKFVLQYRRYINKIRFSNWSIIVKLDNLNSTMYLTEYKKNIADNYSIFILRKEYAKEIAPEYLNQVTVQYLKAITGVMRTIAYEKKLIESRIIYKDIIFSKYFNAINNMSTKNLGLLKKFEFKIIKNNSLVLPLYFRLKGSIYYNLKK